MCIGNGTNTTRQLTVHTTLVHTVHRVVEYALVQWLVESERTASTSCWCRRTSDVARTVGPVFSAMCVSDRPVPGKRQGQQAEGPLVAPAALEAVW